MKKKNIIEFVPTEEFYLEKNIKPSSMLVPQWYKDAPQIQEGATTYLDKTMPSNVNGTFKMCSPLLDSLTSGYMMVLSADIEINENLLKNPEFAWRINQKLITIHTDSSWHGIEFDDYYFPAAFKWTNFFGIKTPSGYSTMFMHPLNRTDLPFYTFSGIVDTDTYNQIPVNFPFLLKNGFNGIIEAGTPIVQLMPFKRDEWKHFYSDYNQENIQSAYHKLYSKIKRSYKKQFWQKKVYQ